MEPLIILKTDTKADIKWVFKDKEYFYPTIEFTLDRGDLIIRFIPARGLKHKKKRLRVKRFKERSAAHLLNKYPNLGRHFEIGVLTVYRDLGLPLYNKHTLRDV